MQSESNAIQCPAILIAAPGCHQGRTSVTAALARYHRNQGRRVRVLKAGPDFLDPYIYQCASGQPVDNLDLWLLGKKRCQSLLYRTAREADLILIECSIGLYDSRPVCSELSERFGLPIMAVVDGSARGPWAEDFTDDLVTLGSDLQITGVLVNKVAANYQPEPLRSRLQPGVAYLGHLPEDRALNLGRHHQELLRREVLQQLDKQLDRAAELVEQAGIGTLPEPVTFHAVPRPRIPPLLEGLRIGIARDEGFAFIYPANVALLEQMGAQLEYFSPLHDPYLPEVDSLWFPGGYPELYLDELAANLTMKASIREFHQQGKAILAECGGMMYMMGSLMDRSGIRSTMVGLLPGRAQMLDHSANSSLHSVTLDDQKIRGHVFHHSRVEADMEPVTVSDRRHGNRPGETLYQHGSLTASYVHFYFPSNPLLTAKFFGSPLFADQDN